ncbi:MAG TPA: hypothetical protein PKE40_02190 [Arachnia sp.]|nr:hypothetical protein [Arachnia sp.]HMT85140.1 hypothetical protein [Arachnia sp.]
MDKVTGVSRRSVVRGAAWSVPVVAAAVATPYASATLCAGGSLSPWSVWTNETTGDFVPSSCGAPQPQDDGMWWQWCDATATSDFSLQKCVTADVVIGQTYALGFTTQAFQGFPTPDSPANLVLRVDGAQIWAGYTVGSLGVSGNPGGTNSNLLFTAQNDGNLIPQNWSPVFTATATGPVTICFTWTAFAKTQENGFVSTDDIGTTLPVLACIQ